MKKKVAQPGSILVADDLKVGAVVAVRAAAKLAQPPLPPMPPEIERRIRLEIQQPLPIPAGVPFRIKSINLPFVLGAVIEPDGESANPLILDVSKVRLVKVPPSFVRAIGRFGKSGVGKRVEEPPFDPNR